MKQCFGILILSLSISACTGTTLPKYQLVDGLRILALQAASPEASPGDVIPVVNAMVLDPKGNGRTVQYLWTGCVENLARSTADRFECVDSSDRISLGEGTSSQAAGQTIPATIHDLETPIRKFNGVNYIVSLKVTAGSESVTGFKRIVISQGAKSPKNSNPTFTALARGGVVLSDGASLGTEPFTIIADIPTSSFESYSYMDNGGSLKTAREDLLLSWFTTEGSFQVTRTFSGDLDNIFTPPGSKSSPQITIIVVAHDGRGGAAWKSVQLQ